ncbi:hypothetical protein RP20_CCG022874 [Aedes albopictus]|nr:hypothetical protein RP20_CCG022874 [Aedes albopictus]
MFHTFYLSQREFRHQFAADEEFDTQKLDSVVGASCPALPSPAALQTLCPR